MTNKQKQEFTRRITQSNRSGLVLIKFEMLFIYMDDICSAYKENDKDALVNNVRYADAVLRSFQETLDFSYELASKLYSLYDYHRRQLAKVLMKNSLEDLQISRKMLMQTYTAFQEAAKQDTSAPLMKHAQQVYAGYTYGRSDINENCEIGSSRGFLA